MADNGTTSQPIPFNLPEWMAISAFTALAWYNVLQLNISIFLTFKRRRGLYFWSLLVSGYGVIFHSVGFLIKLFELTDIEYLSICLITIGWWSMVTGQSLVLYSRLHLVVKEQRILKGVLIMIIWNAITLHIPTTILTFGCNSPDWQQFVPVFNVYERIQMTIFSLQELIISSIYLWAAFRLLKPIYRKRIRTVMMQLLWVNFTMVGLDISILVMEYLGFYPIEATLKSMIYAIKLILEFAVLNQLMRLANSSRTNSDWQKTTTDESVNDGWDTRPSVSRKHRLKSRFRPNTAPVNDGVSISTDQDGETARIGSIARRNESVAESRHDFSALFAPRKEHHHLDVPNLIIDPDSKEFPAEDTPTTIVTNPAAFSPQHRKPRDPFSLDGLSPTCSESDLTAPEKAHTKMGLDGSGDTAHYTLSRATNLPDYDGQDEEKRAGSKLSVQPGLLRTRRDSVDDFDDLDEAEISDDCETDPAKFPSGNATTLQRNSGAFSARDDNITPSWLSGEEAVVPNRQRVSNPRPLPEHSLSKRSSTGRAEFAVNAHHSIQNDTPRRRSHHGESEQHQASQRDSVSTEFGHSGVRHSVPN